MTEWEELAASLTQTYAEIAREFPGTIDMDTARKAILRLNPEWRDGGETHQVIDNTAYAFMLEHNASVKAQNRKGNAQMSKHELYILRQLVDAYRILRAAYHHDMGRELPAKTPLEEQAEDILRRYENKNLG